MGFKKSQAFYSDFIISTFIFAVILLIYFAYIADLPNRDAVSLGNLITDAKAISSSLMSPGQPSNWNANNVIRAGFVDSNNKIDNAKFTELNKISYNKSKKLFSTNYDYFAFFANESGDAQNIEGFCGFGSAEVNISYNIKAAYYYKDEDKLRQFMTDAFEADIYQYQSEQDIDELIQNIGNYNFIVIESPEFSTSTFNSIRDDIEDWASSGGIFMLSARPVAAQGRQLLGAKFYKVSGDAGSDKPATVVREDEFVAFNYADQIIFNQVYYIEDTLIGSNLFDIARLNESDVEIEDIMDNKIAIARWPYGEGKVLFFSDFDADYLAGDFQQALEASTKKWIKARCLPVDISRIKREKLVKFERLLVYNSDIVKMVLYLWQ
ncbi:hypothetical protein J4458_04785 [Candidatus Woesearchaeota archaeon]|nr:hypothetical protein [Candidatus Woesearchaeota archaeon]